VSLHRALLEEDGAAMPISKRPKAPVNYTECNDSDLDDEHIPIAKTSTLVQSDSDCDSPGDAQQPSKKRGTLLAYARPGIDNTIISEPSEARGQGISGKITKRTRYAARLSFFS
jgi:hypothetical protein